MATASLNGHTVTRASASIPAWGCWYAEVTISTAQGLSGRVTLKIADLTLIGTVLAGGADDGTARSHFRIVGGAGGWGRTIKAKSETSDAGVKTLKVIGDAAREVGETLDVSTIPTTDRTGPYYARRRGPASRVLETLKPQGWYVGEDGITRIGARSGVTMAKTSGMKINKALGTVELAVESIAKILPGAVVAGITAVDVQHEIAAKGLRSRVWGKQGGTSSRRLEALRTLILQLVPQLPYYGTWEYRVVLLSGSRLDLQPVRVSTGMPDLRGVRMRPGVAGAKSTLIPGARVLVSFVDADPGRPEVIAFEDSEGQGFKPLLTEIDATTFVKIADGLRPIAATGDVAAGIFPIVGTTRVMG